MLWQQGPQSAKAITEAIYPKGAESEFTIDSDTPVYGTATDGDTSLLKPGAAVFVIAQKQDDGKLASARLYAEKDGIKPSM